MSINYAMNTIDHTNDYLNMILEFLKNRDDYTYKHSCRVAYLAMKFGKYLGYPNDQLYMLELAGYLHDLGKTKIPDSIIHGRGQLTAEERELIMMHPQFGFEILETIPSLNDLLPALLYHHERYDGRGYPTGLKGEEIPEMSRLIAIVDSYDAMSHDRPYRKGLHFDKIITEIYSNRGFQFDPVMAEAFCDLLLDNLFSDHFTLTEEKFDFRLMLHESFLNCYMNNIVFSIVPGKVIYDSFPHLKGQLFIRTGKHGSREHVKIPLLY